MVKRIVRKKKKPAPKAGAAAVLETEDDGIAVAPEAAAALGDESAELVAERLRVEALRRGGREHKALAALVRIGKPLKLKVARGAPTCCAITDDGEWLWYGDKNGHVFRCNLPARSEWTHVARHNGPVLCMAITKVANQQSGVFARGVRSSVQMADAKHPHLVATGGADKMIKVIDADDATELRELQGHRGPVTGLAFRLGHNTLYSGAADRTLKVWDAESGVNLDTFYGPTAPVTCVAAGWREEPVVASEDRAVRLFKIEKETQIAFEESQRPFEGCAVVNDSHFVACGDDGNVGLYSTMKKRPLDVVFNAHGSGWQGDGTGLEMHMTPEEMEEGTGGSQSRPGHNNWVTAVAAVPYSDLVASGGVGGRLNIYRLSRDGEHPTDFVKEGSAPDALHCIRRIKQLGVEGIVTAMHFNRPGTALAVAVAREQRLGRWLTDRNAANHLLVYSVGVGGDGEDEEEEAEDLQEAEAEAEMADQQDEAAADDAPAGAGAQRAAAKTLRAKPLKPGGKGAKGGRRKIVRRVVAKKRQIPLR